MEKDPIIREVRKNRDDIAKKSNYDIKKIFKVVVKRQKSSRHKLVSFSNSRKSCLSGC